MQNKITAQASGVEVLFEKHCWSKIHGWCKAADSEVSGTGLIRLEKNNVFKIYDVFLPKQQCSGSYTDVDNDAMERLNKRLTRLKVPPEDHRVFWHTHYNFNTFWSGTDEGKIKGLVEAADGWLFSIVINQAGEWKSRLDFVNPIHVIIHEPKIFLVPNSRRMKRKRNFKTDIQKWVRPMKYENSGKYPQEQQNNMTWYGSEFRAISHYQKPNGEHRKWWEVERKENEPVKMGSKYIIHGGKLMTDEAYKQSLVTDMPQCLCPHDGDWEKCYCSRECDFCLNFAYSGGSNEPKIHESTELIESDEVTRY